MFTCRTIATPDLAQSSAKSSALIRLESNPTVAGQRDKEWPWQRTPKAVNATAAATNLYVRICTCHVHSKALTPVPGVLVVPVTGLQEHL